MLLTSVAVVSKYCLTEHGGELPHVAQCIDAFMDVFSLSWNFAEIFEKTGSLYLMQYVSSKKPSRTMDVFYRRYLFNRTSWFAAEKGDLEAVRWLVERYLPEEFLTKVVNGAAAGGHVEILQWLFDNHQERACWGGVEMCRALINGHREAVKWLRVRAPPRRECLRKVMEAAGQAGNLDVIWWLYEDHFVAAGDALWSAQLASKWTTAEWILENCEVENPSILCAAAARRGELPFLEYVYSLDIGHPNKDAMHAAAAGGHLDIVKWLHGVVGLPLRSEAARNAAENGHLEVVRWFQENNCHNWEAGIMIAAASGGHLEVLQWLRANCDDPCDAWTMYRAVRSGHLEVVKWLNDEYTWEDSSTFVMDTAAQSGHLEILKWLHVNRSEGCSAAAMDGAARAGHLDVVKWLHHNRTEGCTRGIGWAARRGHLEIVKWLHANRSEGCTTWAMDSAAMYGHLDVVKWLHYHRSEGCTVDAMTKAIKNGHFEVVLFLSKHRSEGFAAINAINDPCLELTQWLIADYPEQTDGWTFVLPNWDWYFHEWCQAIGLQKPQEAINEWVCNSALLRLPGSM